eukprot:COSAG04_NODE_56_length_30604_cov_692.571119_42_plen_69_part_00
MRECLLSAVVDDIDIAGKYIGVSFTPFNFDSEEHQVRAWLPNSKSANVQSQSQGVTANRVCASRLCMS